MKEPKQSVQTGKVKRERQQPRVGGTREQALATRETRRVESVFERWRKLEVERLGIVHRECDEHPEVQQRRLEVIVAEQERLYRELGRTEFERLNGGPLGGGGDLRYG